MIAETQSHIETGVVQREELEALQAILSAQGEPVSHKEASDIACELIGFFEALDDNNEKVEVDSHA